MNIPLQDFDFSVLNDPEFKEDSVREEIIAPLLRALGYRSTGNARIVRSRRLDHPYVQFGVTKKPVTIIPDYLMVVNERPRWILDAKAPTETVDDPAHIAQAYSYAIHHDVRTSWFAICNGHDLVVYSVGELKPVLRVRLRELKEHWQEVLRLLFPPAMTHDPTHPFAKDFGIHLMRLGVPETMNLVFPLVPVRCVARIGQDQYSGFGMNLKYEEGEYLPTFDFSMSQFEKLVSILPSAMAQGITARLLNESPAVVWLSEPFPSVTITAHRTTKIIENEREMYLPLEVTSFDLIKREHQ
ncbi:restriction endonuclease [Cystobacter fuscus]|uniref:Restriction endonuclease n=1 Tax=Cystobacter fuscus TaxID=43 RepID=A0A250JJL7_9BACT|nr:type I restriction enzyme HsdR N-terminal domain-containing protein [Cystobacter fuscus]ATB44084.1 restriction endonuclease [Cystobacter fuscus]